MQSLSLIHVTIALSPEFANSLGEPTSPKYGLRFPPTYLQEMKALARDLVLVVGWNTETPFTVENLYTHQHPRFFDLRTGSMEMEMMAWALAYIHRGIPLEDTWSLFKATVALKPEDEVRWKFNPHFTPIFFEYVWRAVYHCTKGLISSQVNGPLYQSIREHMREFKDPAEIRDEKTELYAMICGEAGLRRPGGGGFFVTPNGVELDPIYCGEFEKFIATERA